MSTAAQAAAIADDLRGINATKYLSAAGLVILLYDHLLLFGDETRLIWQAKHSWSKVLFLMNRYLVPLFIVVTAYQLSGLSTDGLSTTLVWLSMATCFGVLSLSISTLFVVKRVFALWGRKRMMVLLAPAFILVYLATLIVNGIAISRLLPNIFYFPVVKTCIIDVRPTMLIVAYAAPLCFDIFLFILTCWNALDRPRHMHTVLVSQLYRDGAVFFLAILTLRLFNIIVVASAPLAYVQLGIYFLWTMITVVINRMLITIRTSLESHPEISPLVPPAESTFHFHRDLELWHL